MEKVIQQLENYIESGKDSELCNNIISEIKKQQLADRFFLEETIFRNVRNWDNTEEYTVILLHDFFSEIVENNPLTESERTNYIKNVLGWDDDFIESAYFSSERQLSHYLKNKEVVEDYSIEDVTTPAINEKHF